MNKRRFDILIAAIVCTFLFGFCAVANGQPPIRETLDQVSTIIERIVSVTENLADRIATLEQQEAPPDAPTLPPGHHKIGDIPDGGMPVYDGDSIDWRAGEIDLPEGIIVITQPIAFGYDFHPWNATITGRGVGVASAAASTSLAAGRKGGTTLYFRFAEQHDTAIDLIGAWHITFRDLNIEVAHDSVPPRTHVLAGRKEHEDSSQNHYFENVRFAGPATLVGVLNVGSENFRASRCKFDAAAPAQYRTGYWKPDEIAMTMGGVDADGVSNACHYFNDCLFWARGPGSSVFHIEPRTVHFTCRDSLFTAEDQQAGPVVLIAGQERDDGQGRWGVRWIDITGAYCEINNASSFVEARVPVDGLRIEATGVFDRVPMIVGDDWIVGSQLQNWSRRSAPPVPPAGQWPDDIVDPDPVDPDPDDPPADQTEPWLDHLQPVAQPALPDFAEAVIRTPTDSVQLTDALALPLTEGRTVVIDLNGRTIILPTRIGAKGTDWVLRNGTIQGSIDLMWHCERVLIQDITFVTGDGEDAIRLRERNGQVAQDIRISNCRGSGNQSSHFVDGSRGALRLVVNDCSSVGYRYALFAGGVEDLTVSGGDFTVYSEHGIRLQECKRANIVGNDIDATDAKTAITVRRYCDGVTLADNRCTGGQISIGPDPRDGSPLDWVTRNVFCAWNDIDVLGNRENCVTIWPTSEKIRVGPNVYLRDSENRDVSIASERQGRVTDPEQVEIVE